MLGRLLAACLLAVIWVGAFGCQGKECSAKGCTHGVGVSGEITNPTGSIAIEACFNEACSTTKWNPSQQLGMCAQVNAPWGGGFVCFGDLTTSGLQIFGFASLYQVSPKDGDHYVFKITDEDSGLLLGVADAHVTYWDNYPNGEDCDIEPCRNASVKMAPQ